MPQVDPARSRYCRLHHSSGQAVVTVGGRDLYLGVFDTMDSKSEYARLFLAK
jgi:hypothetical protein